MFFLSAFFRAYCAHVVSFLILVFFSGVTGKKYDYAWGTLLDELSSYLGSIFRKFRAWLDAKSTPADAGFDDCWSDWCSLENAG